MGTTLHAIIETFIPGEEYEYPDGSKEHTVDLWSEIGTWDFGKNYALSMELHDHASKGWPADSLCVKDSDYEYCDADRQWCSLETLETARGALQGDFEACAKSNAEVATEEADDWEGPYAWEVEALEPLLAALRVLDKKGVALRILWYRM